MSSFHPHGRPHTRSEAHPSSPLGVKQRERLPVPTHLPVPIQKGHLDEGGAREGHAPARRTDEGRARENCAHPASRSRLGHPSGGVYSAPCPPRLGHSVLRIARLIIPRLCFLGFAALSASLGVVIGSFYVASIHGAKSYRISDYGSRPHGSGQPAGEPFAISPSTKLSRAYEDRIAALRGEIDRIKSRQLLDQHVVEEKLDLLFDQQAQLRAVHQSVESVLSVAQETGLRISLPRQRAAVELTPGLSTAGDAHALNLNTLTQKTMTQNRLNANQGAAPSPPAAVDAVTTGSKADRPSTAAVGVEQPSSVHSFAPTGAVPHRGQEDPFAALTPDKHSFVRTPQRSVGDGPGDARFGDARFGGTSSRDQFASLSGELATLYTAKLRVLDTVVAAAEVEATTLRSVMDRLDVKIAADLDNQGDIAFGGNGDLAVGGPLVHVPLQAAATVSARLVKADRAFKELTELKAIAGALPIARPVTNAPISSRFGRRIDPFLGRPALHTGIDFKAPRGTEVTAAGAGQVVFVGRRGGYGKLVEIAHGHGLVTRYAHLHRFHVRKGAWVRQGDKIGEIGSTGRSTGPHLHFETRRHDEPTNPALFLRAGADLQDYL